MRAELVGWREALTERAVLAAIARRLLIGLLLILIGLAGSDRPVFILTAAAVGILLFLLVRLRLTGRL
jgi:hypothetical protein